MKTISRALVALFAAACLTGCAGLSVNADVVITYRSNVPAGERAK